VHPVWLVLVLVIACGGAAPPLAWDAPIELATGGGERGPWKQNQSRFDHVDDATVVLAPDGTAVVAWVDHRDKDVHLQVRDQRVNVSRTPDVFSWLPRVVIAGRDIYVLWQEIIFSGGSHGGDILFARSRDGGATFEPPLNLSHSRAGDGKGRVTEERWDNGSLDLVRAPDGTLHAAWTEYEGTLWLARSSDGGATFEAPRAIVTDPAHPARGPALAATADAVYLAWTTGEDTRADIHVASSRDGFAARAVVERTAGFSDAPQLAVDGAGTLHLAYCEDNAVRYLRSRDRGAHWEASRVLSREPACYPQLALDGGAVHVLWEHYPDPDKPPRGLQLASSLDGGERFTRPALVPGTRDPAGGGNGSFQGRFAHKLAVRDGALAVANASLAPGKTSRVWLVRGAVSRR